MSGLQQKSSRTSANSTDIRFTNIEKTTNEISNVVKNHQITATYDPNNPKMNKILLDFEYFAKITTTQ